MVGLQQTRRSGSGHDEGVKPPLQGGRDPTDDGSGAVRSASASIGPEAVTNGGDGSFGVEVGSGRGGFKLDPCATAGDDCGNGPGGPDNPVAGQRPG